MKAMNLLLPLFSFIIYHESNSCIHDKYTLPGIAVQTDSAAWIQDLRAFRDAVYRKDINKVKSFIDFPILNENNEIWFLVYGGDGKAATLLSAKIKPFLEKDFDRYFSKLFSKQFINALLKIKTGQLYKTGEAETITLKEGATSYKMYAIFDTAKNELSLNLASNTPVKDTNGEILDAGEFNAIYYFNVLTNGHIKFKQVRIAG